MFPARCGGLWERVAPYRPTSEHKDQIAKIAKIAKDIMVCGRSECDSGYWRSGAHNEQAPWNANEQFERGEDEVQQGQRPADQGA